MISSLARVICMLLVYLCFLQTASRANPSLTIVNVFARQKAVKEGHQAVIQCQIFNIRRFDVISLTKIRNGVSKTLVYNGNLVVDKRNYFLSKYASKDGATYYVLKIKKTSKEDAGNYTFGIARPIRGRLQTIAVDSVMMDVHYLPGPGNPNCMPSGRLILMQGDTPELSCASEEGNPKVKLYWSMKDDQKRLKSTTHTRNRVQTSTIKVEVMAEDNGMTFVCALYSHPYRNQPAPNCTVGPIRVVNRTLDFASTTDDTEYDTKFKAGTDIETHLIISIIIIAIIISTMIFAILLMTIVTRRKRKLDQKRMYKKGEYDEVIVNDPREKIINDYPEPEPYPDPEPEEHVAYSTTIPQSEIDGRNVNIAIHLNLTDTTCIAAISAENSNAAGANVPPEYAVAAINVRDSEDIDADDETTFDETPDIVPNDDESSDTQSLVKEVMGENLGPTLTHNSNNRSVSGGCQCMKCKKRRSNLNDGFVANEVAKINHHQHAHSLDCNHCLPGYTTPGDAPLNPQMEQRIVEEVFTATNVATLAHEPRIKSNGLAYASTDAIYPHKQQGVVEKQFFATNVTNVCHSAPHVMCANKDIVAYSISGSIIPNNVEPKDRDHFEAKRATRLSNTPRFGSEDNDLAEYTLPGTMCPNQTRKIVEEKVVATNIANANNDRTYTKPCQQHIHMNINEDNCVANAAVKLAHTHFLEGNNDIAYTIPNCKQQATDDPDAGPSPKLSVFFSSLDI